MSNLVQKLHNVYSLGQAVLFQLYNARNFINDPKIRPEIANVHNSKFAKALIARFPETPVPEKIPGIEIFKQNASEEIVTLEPHYYAFVDALEFKDLAIKTLNEIASITDKFSLDINPTLTEAFLDLYVTFIQVNLFIYRMEEKKLILSYFTLIYKFCNRNFDEPNWANLVAYMKDYTSHNIMKKLWEDLKEIGPKVVDSLNGMFMRFISTRNAIKLRDSGVLSITLHPSELGNPSILKEHIDILRSRKAVNWFIFGYLYSPEALAQNQTAIECFKAVMPETFTVTIFREEVHPIYKDYEELFSYKTKTASMSKPKKILKEGINEGYLSCGKTHKERRIFIKHELNTLRNLFLDTPGLLAPKLPLILAALSYAKEEILWWFRNKNPPNKSKISDLSHFEENDIAEMIHLVVHFQHEIIKYKSIISQYYVEYLNNADHNRLSTLLSDSNVTKTLDSDTKSTIAGLLDIIKNANANDNFSEVRQQWYETEINILKTGNSASDNVAPLIEKVYQVIQHTKYVDSLEEIISEVASLRELWYFRESLQPIFDKVISERTSQSKYATTYLILLSQFTENATLFDPPEKERIGQECVAIASVYIKRIMDQIATDLESIRNHYLKFDSLGEEKNAIHLVIEKLESLRKPEKWQPPPRPGSESTFSGRAKNEELRLIEKNLYQLCCSLNQFESIFIYNTLLTPKEFLISRIKKSLKQYIDEILFIPMEKAPFKDDRTITPPSTIVNNIFIYCTIIKSLESQINIDCSKLIENVLLKQVYTPSLNEVGSKLDWNFSKNIEYSNNAIKGISIWYATFLSKKLSSPQLSICYSPNRKGFYSRRGQTFKAEKYMDYSELLKLTSLIGPYGVKIIDRELLRFISSCLPSLKETIKTFASDLTELMNNYHKEATTLQIVKNIRQQEIDAFIQKSIVIGNCLQFRKLLYEALGDVVSENVPLIYRSIYNSFNQYNRNVFMASELVGMDSIAQDAGIDVGVADQTFKVMLSQLPGQDKELWDLLPAIYAVSFITSTYWKETTYNPIIEAHENNAHVLVKTVNDFIINFKALSKTDDEEILSSLIKFLDISATLLLRALANPREKTHRDFASVFIFFDLFVDQCPLLMRNELESVLPYCLLRSMWRTIYGKETKGRKDGEEVF